MNGKKLSIKIHKEVSGEVFDKFNLKAEKIGKTKLEIDLWDEKNKIAYEIVLGNGEEFWKDVLKASLIGAKKLIIFCRKYPDKYVKGHGSIKGFYKSIKKYLDERKLEVETCCIEPPKINAVGGVREDEN